MLCNLCNQPCSDEGSTLWFAQCRWRFDGARPVLRSPFRFWFRRPLILCAGAGREAEGGGRLTEEGVADAVPHRVTDPKQRWRALRVTAAPP